MLNEPAHASLGDAAPTEDLYGVLGSLLTSARAELFQQADLTVVGLRVSVKILTARMDDVPRDLR